MSINYKEIGLRLKQARGKTHQKDWAAELGLSKSYISNVENGAKPSLEYLTAVSAKFQVSLDWLIFGVGSVYAEENLLRTELLQLFDALTPDRQEILLGTIKTILQNATPSPQVK